MPRLDRPSQFSDKEIPLSDAMSLCGPAAAIAFSRLNGRNPTLKEAMALAKEVGWTPDLGMAGPASERELLRRMGMDATLDARPAWTDVAAHVQGGKPVLLSTATHYWTVDDYDPRTGRFHVGTSGTDMRGGAEWMTANEIERLGKGGTTALYVDAPNAATPYPGDQGSAPPPVRANEQYLGGLTATTVDLGEGQVAGREYDRNAGLARVYQDAINAGLDEEGARAAVAVAQTEGGMGGAQGDASIGGSRGTFQLYFGGGQGDNFAQQHGVTKQQADALLAQDPHAANEWALRGYLGNAIREGQRLGLHGADLATYAQRYGQVSVSPERAGQNYNALFADGRVPFDASQDAAQAPGGTSGANNAPYSAADAGYGGAELSYGGTPIEYQPQEVPAELGPGGTPLTAPASVTGDQGSKPPAVAPVAETPIARKPTMALGEADTYVPRSFDTGMPGARGRANVDFDSSGKTQGPTESDYAQMLLSVDKGFGQTPNLLNPAPSYVLPQTAASKGFALPSLDEQLMGAA